MSASTRSTGSGFSGSPFFWTSLPVSGHQYILQAGHGPDTPDLRNLQRMAFLGTQNTTHPPGLGRWTMLSVLQNCGLCVDYGPGIVPCVVNRIRYSPVRAVM